MDDSVIFVGELRGRDSDIIVIESEVTSNHDGRMRSRLPRHCKRSTIRIRPTSLSPFRTMLGRQCKNPIPLTELSAESIVSDNSEIDDYEVQKCDIKVNKKTKSENNDLVCPICLDSLKKLQVQVTNCGHLFCTNCMDLIIKNASPKCPTCRQTIIKNQIRNVFL